MERLTLTTKAFQGRHTSEDIAPWFRQVSWRIVHEGYVFFFDLALLRCSTEVQLLQSPTNTQVFTFAVVNCEDLIFHVGRPLTYFKYKYTVFIFYHGTTTVTLNT